MTYRSVSRYSPDFAPGARPDGEAIPFGAAPSAVPIRLLHVGLFLLGGIVVGCIVGAPAAVLVREFTGSKFVAASTFGIALYAVLLLGYHWTAQEIEWPSLRARFSPVGIKPLVLGAALAIGVIAFTSVSALMLKWAGIKIADIPSAFELDNWTQLPLALLILVVLAPLCEELLFRGLLFDWLRQKTNVWTAAIAISVVFSLIHGNAFASGAVGWLTFTERFLVGLGASALTIRYRSLRPAVAMHAMLNAIAGFAAAF